MVDLKKLKEPFAAKDIEWRVQRSGESNGKLWAMVLAYVTNRAIMDRLDDVCGQDNWSNVFRKGPLGGMMCGISIRIGEEWVTKWDGAEETQVEKIKGAYSASMKRAAVQWGIGRYLYDLEATFVNDTGKKSAHRDAVKTANGNKTINWDDPALPPWALPTEEPKTDNISNQHVRTIKDLLIDKAIDPKAFFNYYGISKVEDIQADAYAGIVATLRAKPDRKSKTIDDYERKIDAAEDPLKWWEANKKQAVQDLEPVSFGRMERLVKQYAETAQGDGASKPQWSPAAQKIIDQVDKLATSSAIDNYRASNRKMIDALGVGEAVEVFKYIENAYQQLIKGEQK